jgi:hypothetical protein
MVRRINYPEKFAALSLLCKKLINFLPRMHEFARIVHSCNSCHSWQNFYCVITIYLNSGISHPLPSKTPTVFSHFPQKFIINHNHRPFKESVFFQYEFLIILLLSFLSFNPSSLYFKARRLKRAS